MKLQKYFFFLYLIYNMNFNKIILDKIDNFYMFFVVSNNLKVKDGQEIETCDKQIQLLSDTQAFMNIISAKNEEDFKSVQCSN